VGVGVHVGAGCVCEAVSVDLLIDGLWYSMSDKKPFLLFHSTAFLSLNFTARPSFPFVSQHGHSFCFTARPSFPFVSQHDLPFLFVSQHRHSFLFHSTAFLSCLFHSTAFLSLFFTARHSPLL